jgi:ABC-type transport system involved in multi-copper enzyme maturation permease subunit
MQEKGTIDLYLSRPIGRVRFLLSRYAAGMALAAANVAYLVGAIWVIVIVKTGVVHPRFLLGASIILLVIAVLMAFAFLIGVVTSSTGVSIMATYGVFFFSALLSGHEHIAAAVSKEWQAKLVDTLYWIFPKTAEMGQAVVALVLADEAPRKIANTLTLSPFLTTAAFGAGCLALAAWLFRRKDF